MKPANADALEAVVSSDLELAPRLDDLQERSPGVPAPLLRLEAERQPAVYRRGASSLLGLPRSSKQRAAPAWDEEHEYAIGLSLARGVAELLLRCGGWWCGFGRVRGDGHDP